MAAYKLPLKGVSLGTRMLQYHLDSEFFSEVENSDVRRSDVDVKVNADYAADGVVVLDFDFAGEIVIPCDRCLDDLTLPVEEQYHITVKPGPEWDDSSDEVLVVPEGDRELDLAPLMRDTVLLTIPIVHSHERGECNPAMLKWLGEHEATTEPEQADGEGGDNNDNDKEVDPRWEALRKLKDNN